MLVRGGRPDTDDNIYRHADGDTCRHANAPAVALDRAASRTDPYAQALDYADENPAIIGARSSFADVDRPTVHDHPDRNSGDDSHSNGYGNGNDRNPDPNRDDQYANGDNPNTNRGHRYPNDEEPNANHYRYPRVDYPNTNRGRRYPNHDGPNTNRDHWHPNADDTNANHCHWHRNTNPSHRYGDAVTREDGHHDTFRNNGNHHAHRVADTWLHNNADPDPDAHPTAVG